MRTRAISPWRTRAIPLDPPYPPTNDVSESQSSGGGVLAVRGIGRGARGVGGSTACARDGAREQPARCHNLDAGGRGARFVFGFHLVLSWFLEHHLLPVFGIPFQPIWAGWVLTQFPEKLHPPKSRKILKNESKKHRNFRCFEQMALVQR